MCETFEKWREVCDDFKILMTQYLDHKSRRSLSMCSKADYEIVRKAPIYVHRIEIFDHEKTVVSEDNEPFHNVQINVQFGSTDNKISLKFWQHLNRTVIKRKNAVQPIYRPNSNYYDESVSFFEDLLKKCNFHVASGITVGMANYPFSTSTIKKIADCRHVEIFAYDVAHLDWWLRKFPENLETLKIHQASNIRGRALPTELLELPQIMRCSDSVHFTGYADFSDAQFLRLQSRSIVFRASRLSDDGVNGLLRRWRRGEGVDGFRQVLVTRRGRVSAERVLRGLDAKRWDETFEREQPEFWSDFMVHYTLGDACWQIAASRTSPPPSESLTVSITDHSIKILATGKVRTVDSRSYTHYSIPR